MKKTITKKKIEAPVLIIFFNRPQALERVFAEVKKAQPARLYLACDGARIKHSTDIENIEKCKKIVANVDWECEVIRTFQTTNLGVSKHPYTAIKKLFEREEKGIILEDDCLANPSFFNFCEYFLEYFKNDNRVYQINGTKYYLGKNQIRNTYYFSEKSMSCGWASWKRCWDDFELDLNNWNKDDLKIIIQNAIRHPIQKWYFKRKYKSILNTQLTTAWDYQWYFHILKNHGLCITPKYNLTSNIGFGEEASHSNNSNHLCANIPTRRLDLDVVKHPTSFVPRIDLDNHLFFLGIFGARYTSHIFRYFRKRLHRNVNK